jgi:uncharacterized coiled-coil protein SlyX
MRLEDRVAMLEEKLAVQADVLNMGFAALVESYHPAMQGTIMNEMRPLISEWQVKDDAIDAKYKVKFEAARKPDGERNG